MSRQYNGYETSGVHNQNSYSEVRKDEQRGNNRSKPESGEKKNGQGPHADFPLRLLVKSEMVGAIIGRQGATIRQITQESRARVDVHRKDNVGSSEKAISIYGFPDNTSAACKRILEVMVEEANKTDKEEVCLKILAHNNLIGRFIGKGGNTIKNIMQETQTNITVSSINDVNPYNAERIIVVRGNVENLSHAEEQISAKLRKSYVMDARTIAPHSEMFPGFPPMMPPVPRARAPYGGLAPPITFSPFSFGMGPEVGSSDTQETAYVYIPAASVGAIIGVKGANIRNIIRYSGAFVKVASPAPDDPEGQSKKERKVSIVGTPEAQWKAQYCIFEKIRDETITMVGEDARLTVEILVAASLVSRIIGKAGQNIKELQRSTGAVIKFPQRQDNQKGDGSEDTPVHISGIFISVQSAQRRIRQIIQRAQTRDLKRGSVTSSGIPLQQ